MRIIGILICVAIFFAPTVQAAQPEVILYPRPLSDQDTRFQYHISLLRKALERTIPEYGPFELHPAKVEMNQLRQFDILQSGGTALDVIIKPTSIERELLLTPIRIPLGKGILGWRIMLIHKKNQHAIDQIKDLKDLAQFTIGQGLGWSDIQILRYNGLNVKEGGSYKGLFKMLLSDRFTLFPRGLSEAFTEWDERHDDIPNLQVEKNLLLHYPFARYFWTANSERGRQLNKRITLGLESIIQDGSFDILFQEHYGDIIRRAKLGNRRLIRLENPTLPSSTPLNRKELWFNPFNE